MSELRPTKKKRSLEEHPHALMPALPPARNSNSISDCDSPAVILGGVVSYQQHHQHWQILHLEQQVVSFQAELDHERAGRTLDAKRHGHAVERAEAQAELHRREAATARELLRETTQQSDERVQQLTRDRDQALHQNRQLRLQLEQQLEDAELVDEEAQEQRQRENERLRNLLVQQAASEEALRQQVAEWKEETARQLEQLKHMPKEDAPVEQLLLEEAPSAILKELSKTRLSLADAERRNRQLERDRNELQQRNRTLVRESEKYKQHSQRLGAVEKEWHQNRAQFETAQAEQAAWREFLQQLHRVIPALKNNNDSGSSESISGPLEVATVIRFLETHKRESAAAQQSAALLKQECEQLKRELLANSKTSSVISEESAFQQQKREWEVRLANIQQQLQTAQQQASLYQREADSLRTLIQTFEAQMVHSNKDAIATTGPVQQALELQLKTAQDQLKVLQTKYDGICTILENSRSEHIAVQQELERVKEKFGKLRDALMVEKQKVTTAEERANAAEELAGKGAFNPDRTRVLHLTETPLVQALKEEVAVLKRQLAERRSIPGGGDPGQGSSLSSDKLNQRLKENFKEQIALFREGVYLMTGFKVDMIPTADTGRPTFRLRSVYAEQEEDHLLLQWPKDQDKSKVTALDILNTDFANKLTKTPAYEYMTKFHSLPAFLASCQLNLFENQTIM